MLTSSAILLRRLASARRRPLVRTFCEGKKPSGGFFSNIRESIERELSKNKEFKESISKLRKDKNLQDLTEKTAEATRKFAKTSESLAKDAADLTKSAAERAAETSKVAAEKTRQAAESAAEKTKQAAEKTKDFSDKSGFSKKFARFGKSSSETAEETLNKTKDTVNKTKETLDQTLDQAASALKNNPFFKKVSSNETLSSISSSVKDAGLLDGWGDAARELFGTKKTVRKVQVSSPPPQDSSEDKVDEEEEEEDEYDGPSALTNVVQEKTGWQKFSERLSQTPIIEDILSGTKRARRVVSRSKVGKAAGDAKTAVDDIRDELRERWETSQNPWVYRLSAAYDATFAETEMSQCITEVRRLDPEFNLHLWLDEMKDDTIPDVIQSYLCMDDESLLEHLSEGAMAQVSAAIKVRRDEVRRHSI